MGRKDTSWRVPGEFGDIFEFDAVVCRDIWRVAGKKEKNRLSPYFIFGTGKKIAHHLMISQNFVNAHKIGKVHDNYNNYYDEQQHHNLFSYRIEKISSVFAITCIVLAFVYILFAIIYTTCGGMSDDSDIDYDSSTARRNWANYEMSTHTGGGSGGGGGDRLRHRSRRQMRNASDKQEPLMGMPPGAITDNEGFITDMVSTSSGSSLGSNSWEREREKQFSGTLT